MRKRSGTPRRRARRQGDGTSSTHATACARCGGPITRRRCLPIFENGGPATNGYQQRRKNNRVLTRTSVIFCLRIDRFPTLLRDNPKSVREPRWPGRRASPKPKPAKRLLGEPTDSGPLPPDITRCSTSLTVHLPRLTGQCTG